MMQQLQQLQEQMAQAQDALADEPEEGVDAADIGSVIYYSAITYTTVGYGDITPVGDIRFFAAIEALSGMVLVGWTASVIFTVMHRIWRQQQEENARSGEGVVEAHAWLLSVLLCSGVKTNTGEVVP